MTVSVKKRLEIANVCYANVAGNFAFFCNPKFRGHNFKWSEFAQMMAQQSDLWILSHDVKGDRSQNNIVAAEFAKEISETLLERSGFLENNSKDE